MSAGPKRPEYEPQSLAQRLAYLVEECGEVVAAAGKSLRWGYASANPELPEAERETNGAWLRRELADLEAAIDRVREATGYLHDAVATHYAAQDALRWLPRGATRKDNLLYLMRRCGDLLALLGRVPLLPNMATGGAAMLMPRVTDLEVAIKIVSNDLNGHPVDPRNAYETLLVEAG